MQHCWSCRSELAAYLKIGIQYVTQAKFSIFMHVLRAMLSRIQDFLNYPGAPECFVPE